MTVDVRAGGLQAVIDDALRRFFAAMDAAGLALAREAIIAEICLAPHRPPTSLPEGKMAVYAFFHNGRCLKCGKVGRKSKARFTSQHYKPGSAPSTLAASLVGSASLLPPDVGQGDVGDWIKANTDRVNLLLAADLGMNVLSLLEAFLHVLWNPEFEGHQ